MAAADTTTLSATCRTGAPAARTRSTRRPPRAKRPRAGGSGGAAAPAGRWRRDPQHEQRHVVAGWPAHRVVRLEQDAVGELVGVEVRVALDHVDEALLAEDPLPGVVRLGDAVRVEDRDVTAAEPDLLVHERHLVGEPEQRAAALDPLGASVAAYDDRERVAAARDREVGGATPSTTPRDVEDGEAHGAEAVVGRLVAAQR